MAGLPEVIGLLYRADWTRLSLSAEWRSETDREPLPRPSRKGRSRWYRAWPGQRQDDGRYLRSGVLLIVFVIFIVLIFGFRALGFWLAKKVVERAARLSPAVA